jgi:hypothetical protein
LEATRVDLSLRNNIEEVDGPLRFIGGVAPTPVTPIFFDLPLLRGDENPVAPYIGATAVPWPNRVAVYSSDAGALGGVQLDQILDQPMIFGQTETILRQAQAGIWDRGGELRIRLVSGAFSASDTQSVLNGSNLAVIGTGDGAEWEVFQFANARLIAPDLWGVSMRLRGQAGSDGIMLPEWPIGSYVALITPAIAQIDLALSARGLA